jgi:hypothetical protein
MPVSPASSEQVAREILRIYLRAELVLMRAVARRVKRGITDPGWAERKLAEVTLLRRETLSVVRDLDREMARQVDDILRRSYELGTAAARAELRALEREIAEKGVTTPRAILRLIDDTVRGLHGGNQRIVRFIETAYSRIIRSAAAQVVAGSQSRRDAAQGALNAFADSGITGFVDDAGRNWELASYAEMGVRTASGQAAIAGHLDTISSIGEDLVIVSDAPQECPLCREWEGEVLSISGRSTKYYSVAEATASGLFHPNCRHDIGLYVPGFTRPYGRTEDPAGAAFRSEQRYLERGVRRWKRREVVGDTAAPGRVAEWRDRLSEHVGDGKRLPYREGLGAR